MAEPVAEETIVAEHQYTALKEGQRAAIAREQVARFEAEIFAHEMNIARLEAIAPDEDDAKKQVEDARAAIRDIQAGIEVTRSKAEELEAAGREGAEKRAARSRPKR